MILFFGSIIYILIHTDIDDIHIASKGKAVQQHHSAVKDNRQGSNPLPVSLCFFKVPHSIAV